MKTLTRKRSREFFNHLKLNHDSNLKKKKKEGGVQLKTKIHQIT